MKKLVLIAVSLLFTLGMATAQPTDNGQDQAPGISTPEIPDQPSTAPNQGLSGSVGNALQFLPEQASDTARNVMNTVVDTPFAQLGDALRNMFQERNQTGNQAP